MDLIEDETRPERLRRCLRFRLFGHRPQKSAYSKDRHTCPLLSSSNSFAGSAGYLKVERDGDTAGIFLGLKSYYLGAEENMHGPGGGGSGAGPAGRWRGDVKFKASMVKQNLTKELLERANCHSSGNLTERRLELRALPGGINMILTERNLTSHNSSFQYKFKSLPSGDVEAFE